MLAAFNAADSFILAVVLLDGAFVHCPPISRTRRPVFGPEPGFNEVSRSISAEAIKHAVRRECRSRAAEVARPAAHR